MKTKEKRGFGALASLATDRNEALAGPAMAPTAHRTSSANRPPEPGRRPAVASDRPRTVSEPGGCLVMGLLALILLIGGVIAIRNNDSRSGVAENPRRDFSTDVSRLPSTSRTAPSSPRTPVPPWISSSVSRPSSTTRSTPPRLSRSPTTTRSPPRTPHRSDLEFKRPVVGRGRTLSVEEIRWCLREDIRIQHFRSRANNSARIAYFNMVVNEYNERCRNRQEPGDRARARNDITRFRSQIIAGLRPPWGPDRDRPPVRSPLNRSNSPDTARSTPNAIRFSTSNTPRFSDLVFTRPPAGLGLIFSVEEVRWCLREDIRIEIFASIEI